MICVVVLKMGIAGAAMATVISQVISAALAVGALLKSGLRVTKIRIHKELVRRLLYIGIPAGLQFVTFDLANLLIQSGINSFGEVTVAAWTAFGKADALTWMISGAFGVSITTFVGQNFGAQQYRRIRRSVWICMGMSVAMVGALSVLTLTFRRFLLGIYTPDADVIRVGAHVMLCIVPFNILFMPVEVFAGTMRGTGYSVLPTVITSVCVCVFRVLWIFLVVSRFHTLDMLAAAYPISWALASTVFLIAYLRGTWLRSRIRECGMEPERR